MTRGSTWQKWDFHLHTPFSVLNNQFGDPEDDATWDRYVAALEEKSTEHGVAAIGITDYFTLDGYKRLREYQDSGRLSGIMLFPNIEFRDSRLISRSRGGGDSRRVNFHVVFTPDIPINLIEEHFLHDLDFVHEEQPFEQSNLRKLKRYNLQEFGECHRQQHAKFMERTALEIGCMLAVVDIQRVKQRLDEDGRFRGRYLLVLAEENLSLIDWNSQDHAIRKQLIQMSHAVFSANSSSRAFFLGETHPTTDDYINEFRSQKPCIWGCDAHGYDQRFLVPDEERFCWIKGEVSWEGLKQILYEPADRVRIQAQNPESTKSIYTIDSISVAETKVNDALQIDGVDITLNPNLVAIIGGRGSGKTALLDLIADCFQEGAKLRNIENSFYFRLYQNQQSDPIGVALRFRSGNAFPEADEGVKMVGADNAVFEQADILYLTQNHIDDFTANPAQLYDHIIDLVFDMRPEERRAYESIGEQESEKQRRVESLNLEIQQLRQQIADNLPEALAERLQKAGEQNDLQQRLAEQEAQQAGSTTQTAELTDRLNRLKIRREQLTTLLARLKVLASDIEQFHAKYKLDIKTVNDQLSEIDDLPSLKALPTQFPILAQVVRDIAANVTGLEADNAKSDEEVTQLETDLGQLQGIDRTIADLRRSIDAVSREITDLDERIGKLHALEQRIESLTTDRVAVQAGRIADTIEQKDHLQSVIDRFEIDQDDLLHGISFAATIDLSGWNDYIDRIAVKVDGRAHSAQEIQRRLQPVADVYQAVLEDSAHQEDGIDIDSLQTVVKQLCTEVAEFTLKRSTSESDFYNVVFSPFYQIGLHIEFNQRPLEALSMGERAVVLLKIILGLDETPLLIDQPEEHLDNRYIYDELMPAFRNAKTKRQIIIATHNPNLVVNTDAEQIIVAEHTDGVLSYRDGTLEDIDIRDSIKTILEGGDQAFKKREEKYGYRF